MSNKPNYYAFSVKDRGRGKTAIWTRIGAVWAHEKGQGLNIELEALPLNFDGKIVLMPPKSEEPAADDTVEAEVAQ
jgi:hypothetical protein